MSRILAMLFLAGILVGAPLARAENHDGPDCPYGEDCGGEEHPAPPAPPAPPMHPGPELSLCAGTFQGYYFNDPAPVQFQIDPAGRWGELHVTAWWKGGMWYGQGYCREQSPDQASIEIYFPNAPVHRGVVRDNGACVEMEGRIDYGNYFRLRRTY